MCYAPSSVRKMSNVTLATMLEGSVLTFRSHWRAVKWRLLCPYPTFFNFNSQWDLMWCM